MTPSNPLDALHAAIHQLSPEQRCLATYEDHQVVFLGVPPSEISHATGAVLEELPADLTEIGFYLGSDEYTADFVRLFANTHFPAQTETLYLGSWEGRGSGRPCTYLQQSVQMLASADFPVLKTLFLGFYEAFVNTGTPNDAQLGDISQLLKRTPQLDDLYLCGSWSLDESIRLDALRTCCIFAEEDCARDHHISSATIERLLSCDFPALEDFCLSLTTEDADSRNRGNPTWLSYHFPDIFLRGQQWLQLKRLCIEGPFPASEKERLLTSSMAQRPQVRYHLFEDD